MCEARGLIRYPLVSTSDLLTQYLDRVNDLFSYDNTAYHRRVDFLKLKS